MRIGQDEITSFFGRCRDGEILSRVMAVARRAPVEFRLRGPSRLAPGIGGLPCQVSGAILWSLGGQAIGGHAGQTCGQRRRETVLAEQFNSRREIRGSDPFEAGAASSHCNRQRPILDLNCATSAVTRLH